MNNTVSIKIPENEVFMLEMGLRLLQRSCKAESSIKKVEDLLKRLPEIETPVTVELTKKEAGILHKLTEKAWKECLVCSECPITGSECVGEGCGRSYNGFSILSSKLEGAAR